MSTFVSGSTFQYDVFVSYAHVDNPTYGQGRGWVDLLVRHLRELLPQKLQRGEPSIWFDTRLPGNEPFPTHIRDAVTQSAALLVVLSENYFSSEWCRAELSLFLDAASQTGDADKRIFLVCVDALEPFLRPEPLQPLLGYEFFVRDEDRGRHYILGSPMADDSEHRKLFFQRLDDLRCELADRLLKMKGATESPETPAPAFDADQPDEFSGLTGNALQPHAGRLPAVSSS